MKRLLFAGIVVVLVIPCFAEPIEKNTACSVAIQAFGSEKRAGEVLAGAPSLQVQEVGNYIMTVMEQLDRQYTDAGKQGIWSNFSDAGKRAIAASAVANCRLHPSRTIDQAADAVYHSVRAIHIQLGVVK